MDLNRYTNKAQQALMAAQSLAADYGHSSIEPVHVLTSLLAQEEGVAPQLVSKIGASPANILAETQTRLDGLPRVTGSNTQIGLSRQTMDVLNRSEKNAKQMKDDYVSTEHILMALADDSPVADLLNRQGIDKNAILQALASIRGGQRVTSQDPESTYESLEKYGRDLTALARQAS